MVDLHMKGALHRQVVYYLWELAGPGRGRFSKANKGPKMSKHHKIYKVKNIIKTQVWLFK